MQTRILIDAPTKDEMNDSDSARLSESCYELCQTLKNVIQGKIQGDLNDSEKMAVDSLKEYVHYNAPFL